jgi:hypothetical protein
LESSVLNFILIVALTAAPDVAPDRTSARFRGAVSLVGAAGYAFPSRDFNLAPGVSAEAGVVFNDRISVVLRGTFATLLSRSVVHAGPSVDVLFGERTSLGVGLAFTMIGALIGEDLPSSNGLSVPIRVSWMFSERTEAERARHGFFVFSEAAPGLAVVSARGLPGPVGIAPRDPPGAPFLLSAVIGVGYGAW